MAITLFCCVVNQRSCQNAVKFPQPRDTRGGEGGVAKEKGQQREAGEDKDISVGSSPDAGLLQDIPLDQQGEWGRSKLLSAGKELSAQLVAKVDLLALHHVAEQHLQNVQGAC
jgi:hypothetical protein